MQLLRARLILNDTTKLVDEENNETSISSSTSTSSSMPLEKERINESKSRNEQPRTYHTQEGATYKQVIDSGLEKVEEEISAIEEVRVLTLVLS